MKTNVTVTFEVANAYGKTLPSPVTGSFVIPEVFETREEIPDGKQLNNYAYVQAVNAKEKAKLRAKATEEALKAAGYEKPDQNSTEVVEANQIKLYQKMFPGMTEEQAKQTLEASKKIAASLVGA